MSIVALKRKSRRMNPSISGQNNNGFSLNGGYRNQGWVGQSSVGRHISYTPFRGAVPMGHGGNNGNYNYNVIKGGNFSANNSDIIKSTIKNSQTHMNSINVCDEDCKQSVVKNFPYTNNSKVYNIPSQTNNIDKIVSNNLCNVRIENTGNDNCNCKTFKPILFKNIGSLSQKEYISIKTSLCKNK